MWSQKLNIAGIQSVSVANSKQSDWMITFFPDEMKWLSSSVIHRFRQNHTQSTSTSHPAFASRTVELHLIFLITNYYWWKHTESSNHCLISAANRSVEECIALPPSQGAARALLWTTSMLLFIGCNVGCPGKPQSKWQRMIIWRPTGPALWLHQTMNWL